MTLPDLEHKVDLSVINADVIKDTIRMYSIMYAIVEDKEKHDRMVKGKLVRYLRNYPCSINKFWEYYLVQTGRGNQDG